VLVVRKPLVGEAAKEALAETQVCVIPRDDVPDEGLQEAVAKATYPLPRAHFSKESWTLEPPAVLALLEKIRRRGVPLAEHVKVSPTAAFLPVSMRHSSSTRRRVIGLLPPTQKQRKSSSRTCAGKMSTAGVRRGRTYG
jgi:hypothetical protein